jgi:hypothetical protein
MAAYGWPVDPGTRISQYFGTNPASYQPDGHTGMDFALPINSPIYAVGKGKVLHSDWARKLGWPNSYYVNPDFTPNDGIDQSAGITLIIDYGTFVGIYAHLNSTHLNNGDTVTLGQVIARSGNTGFSSGPHLHFEVLPDKWNVNNKFYGRRDPLDYISKEAPKPAVPTLTSLQRVTGPSGAKYRPEPTTQKRESQIFSPGTVLNFVGFVHGEVPEGGNSDIWLKGTNGGYVHVSTVTPATEAGLPDLTPKPAPVVNPAARTIGSKPANQRGGPGGSFAITASLDSGFTFIAKGFVRGETVGNSNIWFVGSVSGGYVHSSTCTDSSTNGLNELNTPKPVEAPVTPSKPVTPPTPPVVTPAPSPVVVAPPVGVPVLKAELACVTSVVPAHPDNYQVGNFTDSPTHVVDHQFGRKGVHLGSVKTYFAMSLEDRLKGDKNAGQSSAHFGVEDDEIIQFVSLKNRAYHAKGGNGYAVGIETGPDQSPKTIASVRKLMRELNDYYGYELIPILHKNVPGNATECGNDIDITNYQNVGLTPKTSDKPTKTIILEKLKELVALFERY